MPDLRHLRPADPRQRMPKADLDALMAQQHQGLQPTLPPISLADLVSLPAEALLNELSGGDPTLLAAARYKKVNLPQLVRQAIEQYRKAPVRDAIAQRDTSFHATDPMSVEDILRQGEIVPDPGLLAQPHPAMPQLTWKEYLKKEEQNYLSKWDRSADRGVSVSRVPRVASKGDKAVSFVLDNSKMPPTRPYTETAFRKTDVDRAYMHHLQQLHRDLWFANEKGDMAKAAEIQKQLDAAPGWIPNTMNHQFEFENRTFDRAIPKTAMREMWVDKEALTDSPGWNSFGQRVSPEERLEELMDLADEHGLKFRAFDDGLQMHAGRIADLKRKKRK